MNKMPKAILICGKICCGKSYYTEALRVRENAVVLSCDEICFALFDGKLGERHDEITLRIRNYFYKKSLEILRAGTSVILEWGFWSKADRKVARDFFESQGIRCEFHYVDVSDEDWAKNIAERNKKVAEGSCSAYYFDEGLAQKLSGLFEVPDPSEIDVWHKNTRS